MQVKKMYNYEEEKQQLFAFLEIFFFRTVKHHIVVRLQKLCSK